MSSTTNVTVSSSTETHGPGYWIIHFLIFASMSVIGLGCIVQTQARHQSLWFGIVVMVIFVPMALGAVVEASHHKGIRCLKLLGVAFLIFVGGLIAEYFFLSAVFHHNSPNVIVGTSLATTSCTVSLIVVLFYAYI